jgi:hypothetical protein
MTPTSTLATTISICQLVHQVPSTGYVEFSRDNIMISSLVGSF